MIGKTINNSRQEWSTNSELRGRRPMRSYDSRADALLLFCAIQHLRFHGFADDWLEGSTGKKVNVQLVTQDSQGTIAA